MIRILHNGNDFDLPVNFKAGFARYNVVVSEAGDQTAAFTLPGTDKNLAMLGWSDREDNKYKPLTETEVILVTDMSARKCTMGINKIPGPAGISCTIYLSAGELYSKIKDKQMSALEWPVVKSPDYNSQTTGQRVQYLIDLLVEQYNNPTLNSDFIVAPVRTTQKIKRTDQYEEEEIPLYLNGFERYAHVLDFESGPSLTLNVLEGQNAHTYVNTSANIRIESGYAMTPFLKIKIVLDNLFSLLGYEIDYSYLDETLLNYIANDACFINNVADAIYAGVLRYSQIVPDVTITEFIIECEKYLCGKFIADDVRKKVYFIQYKKLFSISPDLDLTPYLTKNIEPESTDFTRLTYHVNGLKTEEAVIATGQKEEIIDVKWLWPERVEEYFHVSIPGYSKDYTIIDYKILNLNDGIVNKNSVVITNSKSEEEKSTSSLGVVVAQIKRDIEFGSFRDSTVPPQLFVDYKRMSSYLYNFTQDNDEDGPRELSSWLLKNDNGGSGYYNFRLNSNVVYSARTNIPEQILSSMKIYTPKLINGQKVFIESIKYAIGNIPESEKYQEIIIRTIRNYSDRT